LLNKIGIIDKNYTNIVLIQCPKCQIKRIIKVPIKIITQNQRLTTVSIPFGLICNHSFNAFIDKNFKVRGYQKVDFEISKIEISRLTELQIKKNVS